MSRNVVMRMAAIVAAVIASLTPGVGTAAEPVAGLSVAGRSSATPWIAADGSHVAVAWSAVGADKRTDIFVATSTDGGATFGTPVQVNETAGEARVHGEFPPRVALNARGARRAPEIFVLWNATAGDTAIKLARSTDGGRTFRAADVLQAPGAPGDRGWPSLALDQAGSPHAIWLDHRGLADRAAHDARSQHGDGYDGVAMAQKSSLYYSRGAGERELLKGVCYCCKTSLVATAAGSIFASWRQVYPGNIRDIAFAASRDGGRTFEAPIKVSDDSWKLAGCPDDGPAMAADRRNQVHVVWPTVVEGPAPTGAIFYATTKDGRTFTPRQRVPTLGSPKPSHPQVGVDRNGRVYVAWDETQNGVRQVAVRSVTRDGSGKLTAGAVLLPGGTAPGAYPILASTSRGMLVVWTRGTPGRSDIGVARVDARPVDLSSP